MASVVSHLKMIHLAISFGASVGLISFFSKVSELIVGIIVPELSIVMEDSL